jgi:ribonuclease-3
VKFRVPFISSKKSADDLALIKFFVQRFGYRPKNLELFQEAVTHKSIAYTNNNNIDFSNERLEFLGDAVLDTIIAEFLFQKFPEKDEGFLTKVKSKVVELRSILRYNKGRSINLNSLEGNAFEAIIGAIYLDAGYDTTKKIIHQYIFRKYIDLNKILEEEIDFKSRLFIWSQKRRLSLEFKVLKEENNHGTWFYEVVVSVNGVNHGMGHGPSKKVAEQAASKETLILMGEM